MEVKVRCYMRQSCMIFPVSGSVKELHARQGLARGDFAVKLLTWPAIDGGTMDAKAKTRILHCSHSFLWSATRGEALLIRDHSVCWKKTQRTKNQKNPKSNTQFIGESLELRINPFDLAFPQRSRNWMVTKRPYTTSWFLQSYKGSLLTIVVWKTLFLITHYKRVKR